MARTNTAAPRAPNEKKLQFGLMPKMLSLTVIPIIVVLIIVGVFLLTQVRTMIYDLKKDDIDSQGSAAAMSVDLYFEPFFTAAEMIADTEAVQSLAATAYKSTASAAFQKDQANMDATIAVMKNVVGNLSGGVSIFVSVATNNQVLFADGSYYDNSLGIDVNTRLWYQMCKENPNKVNVTDAYLDSVTDGLVVTVATGIYEGNTMVGVVGMDIPLDSLMQALADISIGETGYLTVYDSAGMVLYHPNDSLLMTHLDDIGYSDNMYNALSTKSDSHAMEYTRSGIEYCGSTAYVDSANWMVLACMPYDEFHQEVNLAKGIVNGSFALCIIVLIVIIVFVALAITVPIKTLNNAVGKLAEGDLDVELKSTSKNEIGQLTESVVRLVDRLKNYILYITEVSDVLDEVGHGNLSFDLTQDYVGEFAPLKRALLDIQTNLNQTMFRIADSANHVDGSTNQIASASQALAQGATEQASAVQELSATIQDLTVASQGEAQRATKLSQGVAVMGEQLDDSNRQMQNLRAAMEDISTQSSEIAKIIKTIEDIAFQTNILALNAAVEAARAGAAGKGFAVVADEVRSLAAKSAEAAKSITGLINTSLAAIENGSGLANETADSLAQVARNVEEVVVAVQQFASRYQEQTTSLNEISGGIEQISSVVQNNSATAEESAASSEELAGQAHIMKQMIDKFTLDPRFHV